MLSSSRIALVVLTILAFALVALVVPLSPVLAAPLPGVPAPRGTPVPDAGLTHTRPESPGAAYGPFMPSATPVHYGLAAVPIEPCVSEVKSLVLGRPADNPAVPTAKNHLTLDETENFLVLGMDFRPGGKMWRTDTIMIVAVDSIERKVGIISVPRDLWVTIPGYGEGRINIADFYGEESRYPGGGPALVAQLVEEHLGITIHHWARIQQEGLVQLVETLGGVTITLDCPLVEKTPHPTIPGEYEYLRLPAGQHLLDGQTAKKFVTYRYATTDFNRARRQQQIIWALRQRAAEMDLLPLVPQLWTDLADTFQTDLSLLDVLRLAALANELQPQDVHGITFPRDALQAQLVQGGNQVLVISDLLKLQDALANLFSARPIADLGHTATGTCR